MWAFAMNFLYFVLLSLVSISVANFNDLWKRIISLILGCVALAYFSFMITSGFTVFVLIATSVILFTPAPSTKDEEIVMVRGCLILSLLAFTLLWNTGGLLFYEYEKQEYSNQIDREKEEAFIQSLPNEIRHKTAVSSDDFPYLLGRVGGSACLYDLDSLRCAGFRKLIIDKYEFEQERAAFKKRKEKKEREKAEREIAEFKKQN